jgi:hypothetical protein
MMLRTTSNRCWRTLISYRFGYHYFLTRVTTVGCRLANNRGSVSMPCNHYQLLPLSPFRLMTTYHFVTHWHIEAPLTAVFDTILDSLQWPGWWQGCINVQQLEAGDAAGIGSVRRYLWKSRLPYRICFDARATRFTPLLTLEASTSGDLEGVGRWSFTTGNSVTTVCYDWHVRTTKHWMNLIAPIARVVFDRNHQLLMQQGAEGLARRLGGRLVAVSHCEAPSTMLRPRFSRES